MSKGERVFPKAGDFEGETHRRSPRITSYGVIVTFGHNHLYPYAGEGNYETSWANHR